jgi:hypothetical protein
VKRGSWFSYGSEQIGQGAAASAQFLEQNPATLEKLVAEMKSAGRQAALKNETEA